MQYYVIFALLCTSAWAQYQPQFYSYSPAVGSGSGVPYTLTGQGRITAVRVWEHNNNYIRGVQFRYDFTWTVVAGYNTGTPQELELFEGEAITQVSGKYSHYIQTLVFTTSRGRTLSAGQPSGYSYNHYPSNSQAELRFISGRVHGGLTSIGAHWGVVYPSSNSTALH